MLIFAPGLQKTAREILKCPRDAPARGTPERHEHNLQRTQRLSQFQTDNFAAIISRRMLRLKIEGCVTETVADQRAHSLERRRTIAHARLEALTIEHRE